MFDHHCSACDRTQLIFPSQITVWTTPTTASWSATSAGAAAEQTWLTGAAGRVDDPAWSPPDRSRDLDFGGSDRSVILGGLPGPRRTLIGTSSVRAARRLSSVGRAIHS